MEKVSCDTKVKEKVNGEFGINHFSLFYVYIFRLRLFKGEKQVTKKPREKTIHCVR